MRAQVRYLGSQDLRKLSKQGRFDRIRSARKATSFRGIYQVSLSRTEGIIPAIESSHAVAAALKIAPTMDKDSKAQTASSSVMSTYCALPIELRYACSGPIPG